MGVATVRWEERVERSDRGIPELEGNKKVKVLKKGGEVEKSGPA